MGFGFLLPVHSRKSCLFARDGLYRLTKARVHSLGYSLPAPAQEDVLEYCREKGLSANGAAFWNYYQANGWTAGGRPIRNWQAKLREWEARDGDQNAARSRPPRASPPFNPKNISPDVTFPPPPRDFPPFPAPEK